MRWHSCYRHTQCVRLPAKLVCIRASSPHKLVSCPGQSLGLWPDAGGILLPFSCSQLDKPTQTSHQPRSCIGLWQTVQLLGCTGSRGVTHQVAGISEAPEPPLHCGALLPSHEGPGSYLQQSQVSVLGQLLQVLHSRRGLDDAYQGRGAVDRELSEQGLLVTEQQQGMVRAAERVTVYQAQTGRPTCRCVHRQVGTDRRGVLQVCGHRQVGTDRRGVLQVYGHKGALMYNETQGNLKGEGH